MYNYRTILKRVGIVLIAVGILDIAYFFYYTSQEQSFSSSLRYNYSWNGLVIVVAGVFLLRGSLRAVEIVRWFAAFGISNMVSNIFILLPFLKPAELWAIEFRLYPVNLCISFLVKIMSIALLGWIYTQLRAAPVISASLKSGHSASTPKFAFILGVASIVLLTGIMQFTVNSPAGIKAVELARSQYGDNYKYHVTGMGWSNGNVKANLTAYNEQEIKAVQVEWK
ncbi:hypothetical protein H6S82_19825 [Planktothrix sp. FACHB-1355]|uniref:Uncharacterized protein n=1 Tax=Aerosakkonema funiforme FACHB-1375 TaxID=2949571 RepID=A0A926VAC8_9CYAN|nr:MULTISPECIES: hypothetical protein [Oscillatoriales]MBD2180025.1 hypothetical protein [Aerosakkonema funiforme FACHB-1375]MBD3561084.1 hypothetical protein [Planktothrix sp. FACHB-1355]